MSSRVGIRNPVPYCPDWFLGLNRAGVKPAKFIISEFSNYNERLVAKCGQGGGGGDGGLVYVVFTIHNNENDDK